MNDNLRKAIARAAIPVSIAGSVFGFVGDVIQPLINLASIVAILSFIGAIAALIWFIVLRRRKGEDAWDSLAGGLFVFFVASTIVFVLLTIFFSAGPDEGYLANNIDAVAQFQTDILGIKRDVTEIKQTTQTTQVQVQAIATTQAQGFAEMQRSFAALQAGQGNLIANPQTPQEWYSNARLYQLRGDNANALKAYEGYFKFNLEYIDPYDQYIALLKASDGIARARQTLTTMQTARRDSLTLDLVSARLLDSSAERLARYIALTSRAPQFGPAFYELIQEYTTALSASPTKDLVDRQQATYTTLTKLEQQEQGFTRFYIDKSYADTNLANARKSAESWVNFGKFTAQVDVLVYRYFDGVDFILMFSDSSTAQKLLVGIDTPQPKIDAGKGPLGKGVNTFLSRTPLPLGEHTLYFQYIDANGVASQIYSKKFTIDPIVVNYQAQPPDLATNTYTVSWNAGVVGAKETDTYTFKYSVDSKALDQTAPGLAMAGFVIQSLKPGAHKLYIQATSADGKNTPLVEFPFTLN